MNHDPRNRAVLLVEDDPDDELLTLRALRKANIVNRVVVARDGAEALDYLFGTGLYAGRDTSDLPGTIMLDLKLPKIDGLEVLRRIRQDDRTAYVPVVMLTSSKEERDVVESYRLGANGYVQKPVDFGEFAKAVGQLGCYWQLVNIPPPGKP